MLLPQIHNCHNYVIATNSQLLVLEAKIYILGLLYTVCQHDVTLESGGTMHGSWLPCMAPRKHAYAYMALYSYNV